MTQRYTGFHLRPAASSSVHPGSRISSGSKIFPLESKAIDNQPWRQGADDGHICSNICLQDYYRCPEFRESLTGAEVIDTSVSEYRSDFMLNHPSPEVGESDGQSTDGGSGGGPYDMTERLVGYRQVSGEDAIQDGQPQQYHTGIVGYDLSQPTIWSPYDESNTGLRNFNTSTAWSDSTTTQNDRDMTDAPNESTQDHDHEDDEDKAHGSKEPIPGATFLGLEGCYEPCQCVLAGCRGEHIFETFQSYRTHIKNVHAKAMWCSFPLCAHPRPFGNKSDLDRHYRGKHGDKLDKPFKCSNEICPARVKAFKRKDKLREHDRKYHAEYYCFMCPRPQWFESFHELTEHTNTAHVDSSVCCQLMDKLRITGCLLCSHIIESADEPERARE